MKSEIEGNIGVYTNRGKEAREGDRLSQPARTSLALRHFGAILLPANEPDDFDGSVFNFFGSRTIEQKGWNHNQFFAL